MFYISPSFFFFMDLLCIRKKTFNRFLISLIFRIASTTPLGAAANAVKRVTIEVRQAAPASPVHAPLEGKSLLFFLFHNNGCRAVKNFFPHCLFSQTIFSALPWPVWALAQKWLSACVNVVTVEPGVRGRNPCYRGIWIWLAARFAWKMKVLSLCSLNMSFFIIKMCIWLLWESTGGWGQL